MRSTITAPAAADWRDSDAVGGGRCDASEHSRGDYVIQSRRRCGLLAPLLKLMLVARFEPRRSTGRREDDVGERA